MNRREFIKIGAAAAIGAGVASAIEIPILENSINNDNTKIKQLANPNNTKPSLPNFKPNRTSYSRGFS